MADAISQPPHALPLPPLATSLPQHCISLPPNNPSSPRTVHFFINFLHIQNNLIQHIGNHKNGIVKLSKYGILIVISLLVTAYYLASNENISNENSMADINEIEYDNAYQYEFEYDNALTI